MHKGEQMEKHRTAAICELCNNWQPSSSYWQSVPFVSPNTMLSSQLGSTNPLKSYGTTDLGYFFHVGGKGYQANLRKTLAACINSGELKELHRSTTEKFIFLHIRLLRSSSMISENTSNLLYLTETTCKSHWLYLEKTGKLWEMHWQHPLSTRTMLLPKPRYASISREWKALKSRLFLLSSFSFWCNFRQTARLQHITWGAIT